MDTWGAPQWIIDAHAGVDGAIFISAFSMYRYDASYAVEVKQVEGSAAFLPRA
jgi:hypothetical protein